jgi:23S rRNA (guanosine2251-2'-O)-methyltransferase
MANKRVQQRSRRGALPRGQQRHPNRRSSHEERDGSYYLAGRNPLQALFPHEQQRVVALYLTDSGLLWLEKHFGEGFFDQYNVVMRSSEELDKLVGEVAHQGCVARVLPRPSKQLSELFDYLTRNPSRPELLIVLDEVTDPHNLGAIIRVAESLGSLGIVVRRARSARMSAVVAKSSAGASERVDVYEVPNLERAIHLLKGYGFWSVAAACSPDAVSLASFEFPVRSVLIFGSEGAGIQRLLIERADFSVTIPMVGEVGSLNVSQAAAVFAWAYRQQNQVGV